MTTNERETLFACPFCGGNAQIIEQEDVDGRFCAVICLMCGAGSRQHYFMGGEARDHVADAWNKRVSSAWKARTTPSADAEDARRYRWLRSHSVFANDSMHELWFDGSLDRGEMEQLDKSIDAAIKGECHE